MTQLTSGIIEAVDPVAADHVVFWYPRPRFRVISVWGRPNEDDARFVVRQFQQDLEDGTQFSLVDLREVELLDPVPFQIFTEFWTAHRQVLRATITHSAIVHGGGVTGLAVAGFQRSVGEGDFSQLFAELPGALAFVGYPGSVEQYLHTLTTIRDVTSAGGAVLRRLRELLRDNVADVSLRSCASQLNVSPRTLQRMLARANTSLRHELRKARVSRAMGLLEGTDMKLMAVALEVGFAKLANFTDAFRRQTGSTPAQWRATRRDTGRMVRAPLRAVS